MSMFRPAAEISSDSASSSDESDHEVTKPESENDIRHPVRDAKQGSRSVDEETIDGSDIKDLLAADAESHSNVMTSALLEFYCLTRAADLLNRQHGSHKKYTRESPEAQYLGKKMFLYKSKFLSSHGVLAEGVDADQWGPTRQYYRDNLDALGLSALEGLDVADKKPPLVEGGGDLVLASKTRDVHVHARKEATASLRIEGPVGPLDLQQRPGPDRIPVLEDLRLDPRRNPRPLRLLGSSPTSFPLFDIEAKSTNSMMSRYAVEFSEIRIVGRGSFGEVYHVRNHIDGQDYAVKKIPLSQKRLQQLQCGTENQLENIMKEIRTLARLEHANVVRYYGAWIEQTHYPRIQIPSQDPGKLAYEDTQNSEPYQPSGDESFGVVFEYSHEGQQPSAEDDPTGSHGTSTASHVSEKPVARSLEDGVESIPRKFSEPTYSQLSTFGASDGDIFTDGFSNDHSHLQVQRSNRTGHSLPAVILHIQMSLHPIPLSSYLSQQHIDDPQALPRRHCYHLIPSLKLILNIIAGVDYLHSKGIIHRDLKPANIFLSCAEERDFKGCTPCLSKTGTCSNFSHPRIGDFGLVADISHLNDRSPGTEPGPSNIPKLNRVVGTEFYCPPFFRGYGISEAEDEAGPVRPNEEYFDYTIDESLDVYALGVILFELVYRISTKMERQMVLTALTRGVQRTDATKTIRERPVFPVDFDSKVDQGGMVLPTGETVAESLKTCIRGMLELQPTRRWRCSDVQEHLQGLLNIALKGTTTSSYPTR
ncbi:kinase-like domain-containing protein [Aspergillus falconensis]